MHLRLGPGLSYCAVGDRLVFLDVVADRYFCLGQAAEDSFRRASGTDGAPSGDADRLAGLIRRRILIETEGPNAIAPCPAVTPPVRSLLDGPAISVGRWHVAGAALAIVTSMAGLRCRPLRVHLRTPGADRADAASRPDQSERLAHIAHAFATAGHWISAHDRCLARSLAVARAARRAGIAVDLILGVALGPFTAHCWVQYGSSVVNDQVDTVLTYTPILVA